MFKEYLKDQNNAPYPAKVEEWKNTKEMCKAIFFEALWNYCWINEKYISPTQFQKVM